ncbi:Riboflavin synthase alpha chain [Pichia californica]|uniref:Riboflavin synthase n=1 Tax=Pichia californica TaxID=460514 RepID=A0A9P6WKF8_9ASCO|nr:Riboflavin synthase alpha chain [[Candida] californica]KAG0688514.1 Riboflavin synthase alpha chain [[Candida] californica]
MFTGIVEIIGTVKEYITVDDSASGGNGVSLTIQNAADILGDCHLGDSIAINGTCLTVTEFDNDTFKVGISQETLKKTCLGSLEKGDKVNLERAISGDVRYGGHLVQGHVDTIAQIVSRENESNSIIFTFKLRDTEFIDYIVNKGFICIDGTSLTIVDVDYSAKTFKIMMVAYTQSKVIMPSKKIGDWVNIEVDLTGKLIAKQVQVALENQLKAKDSLLLSYIDKSIERILDEKLKK